MSRCSAEGRWVCVYGSLFAACEWIFLIGLVRIKYG